MHLGFKGPMGEILGASIERVWQKWNPICRIVFLLVYNHLKIRTGSRQTVVWEGEWRGGRNSQLHRLKNLYY